MEPDDVELYRAWADGDRGAGAALVDRHLAGVARFFANKARSRADAHDLASDTFERCAASLGSFRGEGSFRGYLFGIARNVLRDYVRRLQRGREVQMETTSVRDVAPSPSSVLGRRREQRLLLEALRAIPIHAQIVLELMYFEGMDRFEIAEALGVPHGTVASRVRRGRAQLHKQLEALADSAQLLASTTQGLQAWVEDIKRAVGDP